MTKHNEPALPSDTEFPETVQTDGFTALNTTAPDPAPPEEDRVTVLPNGELVADAEMIKFG